MNDRIPRLRIFNPGRLKDDELEATFIARQSLFEKIFKEIVGEKPDAIPQHHLLIGQRGMGKTTLLCRIRAELNKAPHRNHFLPLQFSEEQYVEVDRLSKFWLNAVDAVADALDAVNEETTAKDLDRRMRRLERKGNEAELAKSAQALFVDICQEIKRRPVFLIDNFHMLLNRLRKEDYTLRAFFMREGAPIIVGAATANPAHTEDYGAAFYDGFKNRALDRLTLSEMRTVLGTLAKRANKPELVQRIHQESARLAALSDLTGGNPRTTVLLFELFSRGFSEDAYEDLESLLDYVTPLYQSRLDQLSDQGQLILGTLAQHWSPADTKALVERSQLPRGSVTTQLHRLVETGLAEKVELPNAKVTGYQIAERFFNIWYLMRFASRRQRGSLVCLTKFLQEFYATPELERRARHLLSQDHLSTGQLTYALALSEADLDHSVSHELRTHAERLIIRSGEGIRERIKEILDPSAIPEHLYTVEELRKKLVDLVERVDEDLEVKPDTFADAVLGSVTMLDHRAGLADSEITAEQIQQITKDILAERKKLAAAYGEEAIAFLEKHLRNGLIDSLENTTAISEAIESAHSALQCGVIASVIASKSPPQAHDALRKAIKLDSESAWPWNHLGNLYKNELGRDEEAERAYRKAIDINPKYATAWNNLGILLESVFERHSEAEETYRRAIEINPKYAAPWNNLGILLKNRFGRQEEAEEAYQNSIEIDPTSAAPRNNLGNLQLDLLGKLDDAQNSFEQGIESMGRSSLFCQHNLVFLSRDFQDNAGDARKLLDDIERCEDGELADTWHLHDTLFASREQNWGLAASLLQQALEVIGGAFPADTKDDWFRATAVLLHQGYGTKLIALLEEGGWDKEMLPWFEAIRAHAAKNERLLLECPQEARKVAKEIYDQIAVRLQWLPESTRDIA